MINGIVLGIITWLSIAISFYHFPQWIKRWLLKHPVISDIVASGTAFFFLSSISKSIIAVVGAIVAGLLINFSIMGIKQLGDHDGPKNTLRPRKE